MIICYFINQSLELCIVFFHRELALYKISRFLLKLKDSWSTFLRKFVTQIKLNCSSIICIHDARSNSKWNIIDDLAQNSHVTSCPQDELWRIWIWYWYCTINKSYLVFSSEWNDHWSSPWKIVLSSYQLLRHKLNCVSITATKKEWIDRIFIHSRRRLIVRCFFSGRHWWRFEAWRGASWISENWSGNKRKRQSDLILFIALIPC